MSEQASEQAIPLVRAAAEAHESYLRFRDLVLRGEVRGWQGARGRWLVSSESLRDYINARKEGTVQTNAVADELDREVSERIRTVIDQLVGSATAPDEDVLAVIARLTRPQRAQLLGRLLAEPGVFETLRVELSERVRHGLNRNTGS